MQKRTRKNTIEYEKNTSRRASLFYRPLNCTMQARRNSEKNTAIQTSEAAKWRNKEEEKNAKNATNRKFCGCCAPLKVYTYEYLLCDRGISVSSNIRTHIHCEHIELSSFVYLDKIHEHFSLRFFSRLSFVCVCVFFFVFDDDTCECVDGVVFSNIPHIFTAFHRWLERFTRVAFL